MKALQQTLKVSLGNRSYPIYIGAGLLDQGSLLRSHMRGQQVLVVTNVTVALLYLKRLQAALGDLQVDSIILPDGEQHKHLDTLNLVLDRLLQLQHNRKEIIQQNWLLLLM